ncbi:rRNA maturation RNase YbeY [candidate division WWE3 bacterium RIFOXYC2_FULL_40_11]|nr:MAG: rRNA maturation RNase YbeY [candidate division WWE3 bacterium RIFOXYC2_FULL_40_11]OGC71244.1 MAG: rRNA maturation RNase YbeY [candidate division WWE3 bacterium RIFOXYD1_FULL_40_11]
MEDLRMQISKKDIQIQITITNDATIQKLNKDFRKKDFPTDVLSFELNERVGEDGKMLLGEVIINKDQAQRQAAEYGNDLEHELADLAAHGVLHLLGVHHEEEK